MKPYSKKLREKVISLYRQGETTTSICAMSLGPHKDTIRLWIKKEGITRTPTVITNAIEKKVEAVYKSGATMSETASQCEISFGSVQKIIHKTGIARSRSGEDAWNWTGGRDMPDYKARKSAAYRDWRNAVLTRDGWACQQCGDVGQNKLHSHHILSFKKYQTERFNEKNGITLCGVCHRKLHTITKSIAS